MQEQEGGGNNLELDIVGEDDFLPLSECLLLILLLYHSVVGRIAGAEGNPHGVPSPRVLVPHAEGLDLKPHNAGQIALRILVVQDCEPQVIIEEYLARLLHRQADGSRMMCLETPTEQGRCNIIRPHTLTGHEHI